MKWKSKFSTTIRARGKDYFIRNRVINYKADDHSISGDVAGSHTYHVNIEIEDDKIRTMSCTCPYAAGHSTCKHMAALLFQYEKEEELINMNLAYYASDIEKMIEYLTAPQLLKYLWNRYICDETEKLIDMGKYILAYDLINYVLLVVSDFSLHKQAGYDRFLTNVDFKLKYCFRYASRDEYIYMFLHMAKEKDGTMYCDKVKDFYRYFFYSYLYQEESH